MKRLSEIVEWYFAERLDGVSIPSATITSADCKCHAVRVPGQICPRCEGSGTVYDLHTGTRTPTAEVSATVAKRCEIGRLLTILTEEQYVAVELRAVLDMMHQHNGRWQSIENGRSGGLTRRDSTGVYGEAIAACKQAGEVYGSLARLAGLASKVVQQSAHYREAMQRLSAEMGARTVRGER